MSPFCRWSLWAYQALLKFFPVELRAEFGAEMLEAFEEDLKFEWSLRGARGLIRVWRVALREVIRIGLPGCLENPLIAVPMLSEAIHFVLQSPMLIIAVFGDGRPGEPTPGVAMVAISIGASLTMLTTFAVVYCSKFNRPISLCLR